MCVGQLGEGMGILATEKIPLEEGPPRLRVVQKHIAMQHVLRSDGCHIGILGD